MKKVGLWPGFIAALCMMAVFSPVKVQAEAEAVVEEQSAAVSEPVFSSSASEVTQSFFSGLELNGYLRNYTSFNLNNVPETKGNDGGKVSMNRSSLLMQLKGPIGPANFTAIGRFTREQMTDYLKDLQATARTISPNTDFRSQYDENAIRELYFDIPVGERLKLRLGKQQVVWGETDFFQAMDVVHGYDQSWRSFLEPENEEWRKPLILANARIDVPELNGTLQLLLRPGLDPEKDIGNTYDMFGGRWSQNRSRGFNLNSNAAFALPINYHHAEGDTDDSHYGGRWSGTLGSNDELAYSLNYYHTQAQNPVIFADATAPFGLAFIQPKIDIYGGTLSGKIPIDALDTVYRAEMAYVPDQPFNNAMLGVVKKDVVRSMLGLDTNLHLERVLGTCNNSMLSLQVFDTYILDFKNGDHITNAFGSTEKEHTTWLTGIFTLPYRSDTIKGQLVVVQDVSNGGGIVAPSLEFMFGPSWRLKLEADIFYGGKKDETTPVVAYGGPPSNASLFGSFANSSQFLTRVTYQF